MTGYGMVSVIDNKEVAPDHYELIFEMTESIAGSVPGQFVNVLPRPVAAYDPLLRRPFSVYWIGEDRWSILFRIVGRGTALLSRVRVGEKVDVLGPLGTGFDYGGLTSGDTAVIVGGGVGTPPVFHLSQKLIKQGVAQAVIAGFATKDQVVAVDRWREVGLSPTVMTDDGSYGESGLVTDPLARLLDTSRPAAVFACGPRPMLQAVAALCAEARVQCQIALEEWMGCGVGACLSCVQRTRSSDERPGTRGAKTEWARICVEGPVFASEKVVWT